LRIYPALGNVGAAGVPLTFALALDQGRVPVGSRVGLMGIGSGLHVAMLGIEW
jgi:3-oxoacyl-[acyl-carrier-protein] synthase III